MLNFGPFAGPFGFLVLGMVAAWTKNLARRWRPGDARLFVLPMLINLCILVLIYDLDNVLVFLLRFFVIPLTVIWLGSVHGAKRVPSTISVAGQTRGFANTPHGMG